MNRTQIAAIYDGMPPEQQNMSRETFIKKAMNVLDPVKNEKILNAMVAERHQQRVGEMQRAQIDAALRERR